MYLFWANKLTYMNNGMLVFFMLLKLGPGEGKEVADPVWGVRIKEGEVI